MTQILKFWKKILDRADKVAEDRKNLTAPKSNQELVV